MGEEVEPKEPSPPSKDEIDAALEEFRMLEKMISEANAQRNRKPDVLKHVSFSIGSGDDEKITFSFDLRENTFAKLTRILMSPVFQEGMVGIFQKGFDTMMKAQTEVVATNKKYEPAPSVGWPKGTRVRVKVSPEERAKDPCYFMSMTDGMEGIVTQAYAIFGEGMPVEVYFGDRVITVSEKFLEKIPDLPASPPPSDNEPSSKIADIPVTEDPGPSEPHDPPV